MEQTRENAIKALKTKAFENQKLAKHIKLNQQNR